jgi:hypothetical protein
MWTESVYCAVRSELLNTIRIMLVVLKGLTVLMTSAGRGLLRTCTEFMARLLAGYYLVTIKFSQRS